MLPETILIGAKKISIPAMQINSLFLRGGCSSWKGPSRAMAST
jgi:hypothetical protein